jgi:hypothetical protein
MKKILKNNELTFNQDICYVSVFRKNHEMNSDRTRDTFNDVANCD